MIIKQFCMGCGILLRKNQSAIISLIAEKVYGRTQINQEPPTEYEDGTYCSSCSKKRSQMWRKEE